MPIDDDRHAHRSSADMARLGHRIAEARQRLGEHGHAVADEHDELEARTERAAGELERE